MIAAPVQCDVDGIPKGSHYVRVPIAIGRPNGWRLSGERSGAERVRCSRGFGDRLSALLLGSRRAPQETCHAEIFIDIRPMDTLAVTKELPIRPLRGRGVEQARKPDERYADPSAIDQRHGELILGDQDIQRPRNSLNY